MNCEDPSCEGHDGYSPELPAGSRYCPFCGNDLVELEDTPEDL